MDTSYSRVRIELAQTPYDVLIARGAVDALGSELPDGLAGRRCLVVADGNVPEEFVGRATGSLAAAECDSARFTIETSEEAKTLDTVERITRACADAQLERGDFVVGLGGGVACDLAGFAASIYRRGVAAVHCPTTLLAMVDASVGGKTAANLMGADGLRKNMIGTFWQPAMVLVDPDATGSLSEREFRCGLAECVKHGLICGDSDPGHMEWLEQAAEAFVSRDPGALVELVTRSVAIKARYVLADVREEVLSGESSRMSLNLGHTYGHALESMRELSPTADGGDGPLKHGEAVSLGLVASMYASLEMGLVERELVERVEGLLDRLGLPIRLRVPLDVESAFGRMFDDKKVASGRLRLIVVVTGLRARVIEDPPKSVVYSGFAGLCDGSL